MTAFLLDPETDLRPVPQNDRIQLAHGSGGKAMRSLIDRLFLAAFSPGESVVAAEDQARLNLAGWAGPEDRLAFTTDGFVVDPLFFPGGDLGKLAVCGTVNDLAVGGAKPAYLSCAMILEEGLPIADLERLVQSMVEAAAEAGVKIVTGDTKVVHRGAADKAFITTAGVGLIPKGRDLGASHIRPGDRILVNSSVGEHGAAVMAARGDLGLTTDLVSDCRPLARQVDALLAAAPGTRAIRDATRGGVATVLNEFAQAAGLCCRIEEDALPLKDTVRGVAEILGLDPLYLANEGLFVAVVPAAEAEAALAALRPLPGGEGAALIGEILPSPAGALIQTSLFGGERLVDMLPGDQLPRIC